MRRKPSALLDRLNAVLRSRLTQLMTDLCCTVSARLRLLSWVSLKRVTSAREWRVHARVYEIARDGEVKF
jgi:hypothetical protein